MCKYHEPAPKAPRLSLNFEVKQLFVWINISFFGREEIALHQFGLAVKRVRNFPDSNVERARMVNGSEISKHEQARTSKFLWEIKSMSQERQ